MTKQKHPLDVVAEQLEAKADHPVAGQEASPHFWEMSFAADEEVVGDYPQVTYSETPNWGDTDGLGSDGFPAVEIGEQTLQPQAKWTDVLSSNLWSDGYLLNPKALAAFRQCELGNFREYPVSVRDHSGQAHSLVYLHMRNVIPPEKLDFRRSEFYLTDIVGMPQGPVEVDSFEDWEERCNWRGKGNSMAVKSSAGSPTSGFTSSPTTGRRPTCSRSRAWESRFTPRPSCATLCWALASPV